MRGKQSVALAGVTVALFGAGCDRPAPEKTGATESPAMSSTPVPTATVDVPGLRTGAQLGQPCDLTPTFVFGVDSAGHVLACVFAEPQRGVWAESAPLVGVREVGSPCQDATVAQAPDGRGLICLQPRGWQPGP